VYFYFKAQINRSFRIGRRELIHFVPYGLYFVYRLVFFIQGPQVVEWLNSSSLDNAMNYVQMIVRWTSYVVYLYACLRIYKRYKEWSLNQFSNVELISFKWFRNFIYAMIFWLVSREVMNFLDAIFILDFYQDWWWNLALVFVSFYIGLAGYSQVQPTQIDFDELGASGDSNRAEAGKIVPVEEIHQRTNQLAERLAEIMEKEKLFINQELNLHYLSKRLKTNSVELSAAINQVFQNNFNDYINSLRVEEFIRLSKSTERAHFTLLSNAYDAGFSSKSTFNRAFKKMKGMSPREYLNSDATR
jgi:AraC-like DNA-binding protein